MRACLGEIDRCYQDNIMPFFLNMTSERIGWIPLGDQIPEAVRTEYKWIDGLSITEMEIMHGAYRNDNPNGMLGGGGCVLGHFGCPTDNVSAWGVKGAIKCQFVWFFIFWLTALFMLRNPSFVERVPERYKKHFIDSQPIAPYKLQILKKMIQDRFPVSVHHDGRYRPTLLSVWGEFGRISLVLKAR